MLRTEAIKRPLPLLLTLLSIVGASALQSQQISTFAVSQAHQVEASVPALRAYLDVLDEAGQPVGDLASEEFVATLGERGLELGELEPMVAGGQGIAYVFLVDISRSLSTAEFDRIVAALEAWIGGLREVDRAAILAFGETTRLLVDFTADREALASALRTLGPTDDLTLLHRALFDGFELCQRQDEGLPGRRVLIVLTDGRDEDSGLTEEDVVAKLRTQPTPIYAIGYSRLRNPETRRRYLDVLNRFATNSGGAFFAADRTGFGAAYGAIREAIARVWVADFTCPECIADGREYRFQATVERAGRVHTDGIGVRMLPTGVSAPPAPETAPEKAAEPPATQPDTAPSQPALEPGPGGRSWARYRPWAGATLILLLAAAGVITRVRRNLAREKAAENEEEEEEEEETPVIEIIDAGIDPEISNPSTTPLPMRGIRLVVVRGSRAGRQYRFILQGRAVVGARSSCDCVLVDEPNIAPEQFELLQHAGQIYLRDLSPSHATLVDGLQIEERQALRSDDLIGTGEVILRIVFD